MSTPAAESAPLIAQYIDAAEAYGEAVKAGDPERVNAAHAAIQTAFDALAAVKVSGTIRTKGVGAICKWAAYDDRTGGLRIAAIGATR